MTSQELVKYQSGQMSIPDLRSLAGDFVKSGYFADAREAAQAVVKIQAGLEMGFGPVYSMTKIYIVKGKIMVSAEAMGAMVKRSGRYDYTVKSLTDSECILEFTEQGKVVYTSKFTMEDARRADLVKQDSGWTKWPRAMLISKALSQGARIVCPHVIAGVYTPADFGVETDEAGEPAKTTITVEPAKPPESPPQPLQATTSPVKEAPATTDTPGDKDQGIIDADWLNKVWKNIPAATRTQLTKQFGIMPSANLLIAWGNLSPEKQKEFKLTAEAAVP